MRTTLRRVGLLVCLRVGSLMAQASSVEPCPLTGLDPNVVVHTEFRGQVRAAAFLYGTLWILQGTYGSFTGTSASSLFYQQVEEAFYSMIDGVEYGQTKDLVQAALSTLDSTAVDGTPKDIYGLLLNGALYTLDRPNEMTTAEGLDSILYAVAAQNNVSPVSADLFITGEELGLLDEKKRRMLHDCDPTHGHSNWHEISTCFPEWLLGKVSQH